MKNINPTQTSAWQVLQKHFDEMKDVTISELFARIATVFLNFPRRSTIRMLVDFSKNRITGRDAGLTAGSGGKRPTWRALMSMFSGGRSGPHRRPQVVLFAALRNRNTPIVVDGKR